VTTGRRVVPEDRPGARQESQVQEESLESEAFIKYL
jgi:hypothetical protein